MKLYNIIFIFIIIFFSLGTWQLFRLHEKNIFLSSIAEAKEMQSLDWNEDITEDKLAEFTKIRINGKFDCNKNILLYSPINGTVGYYVLNVYYTEAGFPITVNRGWIEKTEDNKIVCDNRDKELIGFVRYNIKKPVFSIIKNDYNKGELFYIDIDELKSFWNISDLKDAILYVSENTGSFKLIDLTNKIPNNHMQYAITWYLLCIASFILFILHKKLKT